MKTGKQIQRIVRAMQKRWQKDADRLRELGFDYGDADSHDAVGETLRNLDTTIAVADAVISVAPRYVEKLTEDVTIDT